MARQPPHEAVADHLTRLAARGVTHISGTPSHWRKALMSAAIGRFLPSYVRLSGEIADQAVLDSLRRAFPDASIGHAYASTEAGVVYILRDGKAGFPAAWLDTGIEGVALRIADGVLEIRNPRSMLSYAGGEKPPYTADGWLVTGDLVERIGKRVHFCGRADAQVRVDGMTVAPERIEQLLLQVPGVQEAVVHPIPATASTAGARTPPVWSPQGSDRGFELSPGNANALAADVIAAPGTAPEVLKAEIGRHFASLAQAEQPRLIRLVPSIDLTRSGKKARPSA